MWSISWQGLSTNYFYKSAAWQIVLLITISMSYSVFSQDEVSNHKPTNTDQSDSFPGVISSLTNIIRLHRKQYDKLVTRIGKNPLLISNLSRLKDLIIDPYFMRSIILHSDSKFLQLVKTDECIFYSLLESGLLKTTKGKITNVMIRFKTTEDKLESAIISKEDFLEHIYSKKCFANQEITSLFLAKNLAKTLKSINFPIPRSSQECQSIVQDWRINKYLPYLCKIPMDIKEGQKSELIIKKLKPGEIKKRRYYEVLSKKSRDHQKNTSFFQRTYLENLCEWIDKPNKFCALYLSDSVWTKITNGEKPKYYLSYKCKNILNKKKITNAELKACANKLHKNPKICIDQGAKKFPSMFPMSNCDIISKAMNAGTLITDYHDCPGNIDNDAIVNIYRIISHIIPQKNHSTPSTCAHDANNLFANINLNYHHEKGWPLKICYFDRLDNKELCEPYIPGKNTLGSLSESKVIAKILYRSHGVPRNTTCEIVDAKTYNPVRLKYKSGCFIVKDADLCTSFYCPQKIIYDQKEVSGLKYIGAPTFDYFPSSFSNEKFSITNIINETYQLKSKALKNFTEIIYFLKDKSQNIAHGIGCAEDLLPSLFHKKSFNQCKPLPFIIDGFIKKNNNTFFTVRTSIDDVHSPRIINWGFIFTALANYRNLHPLNTWALYGINKSN